MWQLRNRLNPVKKTQATPVEDDATAGVVVVRSKAMDLPIEIIHIIIDYALVSWGDLVRFQCICSRWREAGLSCQLWNVDSFRYYSYDCQRISAYAPNPLDITSPPTQISEWFLAQINETNECVRRDWVQMHAGAILYILLITGAIAFDEKGCDYTRETIGYVSLYLSLLVLSYVCVDTKWDIYFFIHNHLSYSFQLSQLFVNLGIFLTLVLLHAHRLYDANFSWTFILAPLTIVLVYYLAVIAFLAYKHPLCSLRYLFSESFIDQLMTPDPRGVLLLVPSAHPEIRLTPMFSLFYLWFIVSLVFVVAALLLFIHYFVFSSNEAWPDLEFVYPPYTIKLFPLPLQSIASALMAFLRLLLLLSFMFSFFARQSFNHMQFLLLSIGIILYGSLAIIVSFSLSNGIVDPKRWVRGRGR
jgi:hypothetical protein